MSYAMEKRRRKKGNRGREGGREKRKKDGLLG